MKKIIHIIWTGKRMPFAYQQRLLRWKEENPGFEVKLWTDDVSLSLGEVYSEIQVHRYTDAFPKPPSELEQRFLDYIEEARANNQYAMVSNLLRHHLMATEGGFYFDTDVEPLKGFDDVGKRQYGADCGIDSIDDVKEDFWSELPVLKQGDLSYLLPEGGIRAMYGFPTSVLYSSGDSSMIAKAVVEDIDRCYQTYSINDAQHLLATEMKSSSMAFIYVRSAYTSSRMLTRVINNFYHRYDKEVGDKPIEFDLDFPEYFFKHVIVNSDNSWSEGGMEVVQERSLEAALSELDTLNEKKKLSTSETLFKKEAQMTILKIAMTRDKKSSRNLNNALAQFFEESTETFWAVVLKEPMLSTSFNRQLSHFLERNPDILRKSNLADITLLKLSMHSETISKKRLDGLRKIFNANQKKQYRGLEMFSDKVNLFRYVSEAPQLSQSFAQHFLILIKDVNDNDDVTNAKLNAAMQCDPITSETKVFLRAFLSNNESASMLLLHIQRGHNLSHSFINHFSTMLAEYSELPREPALKQAFLAMVMQSDKIDKPMLKALNTLVAGSADQVLDFLILEENTFSETFARDFVALAYKNETFRKVRSFDVSVNTKFHQLENKAKGVIKHAEDKKIADIYTAVISEIKWYHANWQNKQFANAYETDYKRAKALQKLIRDPTTPYRKIIKAVEDIIKTSSGKEHSLADRLYEYMHDGDKAQSFKEYKSRFLQELADQQRTLRDTSLNVNVPG